MGSSLRYRPGGRRRRWPSMAASPVLETYPHVWLRCHRISRERGRAVSVRRNRRLTERSRGVGEKERTCVEAGVQGCWVHAAKAPVPARASPPSRNCRRGNAFVAI